MNDGCTIVVDVGKTNSKASVWDATGRLIAHRDRANERHPAVGHRALDVWGIDEWLMKSLAEFAQQANVSRIVAVAHGAAAVLLQDGRLLAPPIDYENDVSAADQSDYASQRDPFAKTGSPALPCGLNLGMQLHCIERAGGPLPQNVTIVPWPQYWAWRLCGIAASEVSSLGCHTDLWRPLTHSFSSLAVRRGWAKRMAPLRIAGDQLGTITADVAAQTGLSPDCVVLCGMHDSNAALLAAAGHPQIANCDTTVLSTGTWFVAMRSLNDDAGIDPGTLDESRDCLINVDVFGRPVPSARFMGGREAELIGGVSAFATNMNYDIEALIGRLPALIANGSVAYPSFVRGVGPFPHSVATWCNKPADPGNLYTIASVYLALMTDTILSLIDSRERLLIDGRFAEAVIFVRALAALRPEQQIFVSNSLQDVAYGALRLVSPDLPPPTNLTRVRPLEVDLAGYAAQWRARAHATQSAA